ncbi:cell division protein ZapA [Clostridium gasigenes]|uniref:Cell division protein ZapA n=1 Tax=Clostridium gasigenes TaxID=94869 RepID=A0A7X0SET8_9CLOT|nr:cell division protein ZapA [Clostridium gasigenes]MBB6621848.1 cell division protein ZapA [Clostridium gasigenes]MBB6716289.1 cell division protein ZapA [Clostridium gasigenes]MBU3087316.1 cell division protein ZapA [Clostridium gasigenes]MBU3131456.1 cell division protein ZapA [Clostridium gasigenes]MBU3134957.1 cell division protein ZapA [Clostridium gasigenes]
MNTVTVKINGMEYNLKGKENQEYLLKLAGYVDGKVREIMTNNSKLSSTAVAVLAGLNIADELFKCDKEAEDLIKKKNLLEERHLTLKERIKEIREEMDKTSNIKDEEINSITKVMKIMEEKVLGVNKLSEKVNLLTNELKEMDTLKSEVEKLKGQTIYYKEQLKIKKIQCEDYKENVVKLNNEIIKIKDVKDEEYRRIKREVVLLNSGNDDLRSAVEDSYSKISTLEDENNKLLEEKYKLSKEILDKEKEIVQSITSEEKHEYKEEIESLGEQITIMEQELKSNIEMKEKIKIRSKEMHFQLQNSKFKVLNLEKKLIDVQIELAKSKKDKSPFLK